MPVWRVRTESGSEYEIREILGEWCLRAHTPPSSAAGVDLRHTWVAVVEPIPWPLRIGDDMLIIMQWAPGHLKLRRTTPIVHIDGPAPESGD